MNANPETELPEPVALLLEKAAEIARGYGLEWTTLAFEPEWQGHRPDAYVEIGRDRQTLRFVVETKARPRTGQAGAIFAQLQAFDRPRLLIADYVNPQLAEELRRQELCFIDLVGNAYLKGEGLLIWVTGRKDLQRIQIERETRRAFRPTGLRVIFALLCRPELVHEDYRTLARVAGVALGTVQWVMRDLREEGYLITKGRTDRRLIDLDRLLDEWAEGYARDLKPRLRLGRFETEAFDEWKATTLQPHQALWGGEAAAALMTRYLEPETLTIWADTVPPRLVAELRLRPREKGRVEIRKRFWARETHRTVPVARLAGDVDLQDEVAPPVLVYAELLAIGDARANETAQKIRHEWIDRPFRDYRAHAAG